jgi:hypothetical protein
VKATKRRMCQCGCGKPVKCPGASYAHGHHLVPSRPLMLRFWSKVEKTDTCWLWQGHLCPKGFGRIAVGHDVKWLAHKFAYELFVGMVPDGMSVCHKPECGDESCVRPDHLFLATAVDRGSQTGHLTPHGEAKSHAVLTDEIVRRLRAARGTYGAIARIAREFGVPYYAAWSAAVGRTWKHVPMEAAT